jgi:hypothetical protein
MNGIAGIPSHAYYHLNTNTPSNPQDSRAMGSMIQSGAGTRRRRRHRHRRRVQKSKVVKNKNKYKNKNAGSRSRRRHKKTKTPSYVNYAGRQIGHQSQRQSQRQSQSGGFQSDANLIVSSLGNLVDSGFATLKGTDNGPSALPFSDVPYERNL